MKVCLVVDGNCVTKKKNNIRQFNDIQNES